MNGVVDQDECLNVGAAPGEECTMNVITNTRMTVPIPRMAKVQPEGRDDELVDAKVVKMPPEGARNVRARVGCEMALRLLLLTGGLS